MWHSHWRKPLLVNTFYVHLHITNFKIYVWLCVCVRVYLSLYMARIYGCGVVNVVAYLVSVCEMHFMNLLWLLMWRHLHIATHSQPPPPTHTHTHAQGVGATWRLLYAALASHNQRQRVASPEFGLTGVVIKGAENDVKGERREGCAQRELTFTFTAI